jgi:hypothetical protein
MKNYEDMIRELNKMAYKDYLQTEHWQHFRLEALKFFKNKCCLCNSEKYLQVHHETYKNRGRETFNDVIVLCKDCHSKQHEGVPWEDQWNKYDCSQIYFADEYIFMKDVLWIKIKMDYSFTAKIIIKTKDKEYCEYTEPYSYDIDDFYPAIDRVLDIKKQLDTLRYVETHLEIGEESSLSNLKIIELIRKFYPKCGDSRYRETDD